MKQYKTINTFTQIPSIAEIIGILVYLGQIVLFSFIIQRRFYESGIKIIMIVIYSICVLGHLFFVLLTACNDPSDQLMIRYKNNLCQVQRQINEQSYYCDLCLSYVNKSSKHCSICNRCTEGFDHHCIWINNCVGSKNYKVFIMMLGFTFANMVFYLICIGLLWKEGNYLNFIGEMVVLWISAIVILIFTFLVLYLIGFHIYLYCICMTTYDFLKRKKKNKEKLGDSLQNILQKQKKKIYPQNLPEVEEKKCEQMNQCQSQQYKQKQNEEGEREKEVYPWRDNFSKMNNNNVIKIQNENNGGDQDKTNRQRKIKKYLIKGMNIFNNNNNVIQPIRCNSMKNIKKYQKQPNILTFSHK